MKIENKLILENSKKLNILYVEDDEKLRKSSAMLFKNFFNLVDTAADGLEGFTKFKSYLEDNKEPYDLIISDINMPNLSGIEMSEKIRTLCVNQAIIFITAHNDTKYLHDAIALGVNGFLAKPIELEELNKVLYTTTQIIVDRKLVQKHYEQIEDINMLHVDKKDASGFSSAKDVFKDLVTNKEKISKLWMNKEIVNQRLSSQSIDVEFFRSHYGIRVIEYFLKVIDGEAEVGNCPVIFTMLDFFKNKNLPLEDIFMICVQFKNTISAYIFNKYSFNDKLFDDISYILDKNFEGVIINYLDMKTIKKEAPIVVKVEEIKEEDTLQEDIDYADYVMDSDVYELEDLEEDIDSLAVWVTTSNKATVEDNTLLATYILRYGTILNNYPIFTELGSYISKLGLNLVDNAQLLYDDKERMSNITALIEGFVNDLIVWRKEIFQNNIQDYKFLNSSFSSNVDTIIMFIAYDESASQDDSFEDDMFF